MENEVNKKSQGVPPQQSVVQIRTDGIGPQNPDRSEPQCCNNCRDFYQDEGSCDGICARWKRTEYEGNWCDCWQPKTQ